MNDNMAENGAMRKLINVFGSGENWRVIDDVVMGGCSQGQWRTENGVGTFSGVLSLENGGGFSSVRSGPFSLQGYGSDFFRIRVRGDGRTYQFRVRVDTSYDGPAYRAEFSTEFGLWQEIDFPQDKFQAVFRGNLLQSYPALRIEDAVSAGFLLADRNPGTFNLEVAWIGAGVSANVEDGTSEP